MATDGIKTYPTSDPWLPLDRRWAAMTRISGRTIGAYGATREDAIEQLRAKLAKLASEGANE